MTPALVLSKNIFYRNRESEHIFNLEDCVRIIISWSKWRDSNSRHPAPKELVELFSNIFVFFLAPFIPEKLLFRTIVSTVSACSEAKYGQQCGQIQRLPGSNENRGAFCFLRCGDCSLENENRQVLSVPKTAPL